jgi:hypothetical protein|tara:strand:- start:1376 stop:1768 length:393 start_codon:yes stop_codon:yes gene_type:complete
MAITNAGFKKGSTTYKPTTNVDIDVAYGRNYDIVINTSYSGKKYSTKKHDLRKSWKLKYSYLSEADRTIIQNLHDATDGTFDTFLFAEDNDFTGTLGTDHFTVRFTRDDLTFNQIASGAYSVSFSVEEEL